jgi:hypothetical protein
MDISLTQGRTVFGQSGPNPHNKLTSCLDGSAKKCVGVYKGRGDFKSLPLVRQ